jgi:hypothetical protein
LAAETAVSWDAASVRQQLAGVIEDHDTIAEQAPSLFWVERHKTGRIVIRCVRRRTRRLVLAHSVTSIFTGAMDSYQ